MRNEPGLARRIKYFVAAQPRWLSTVIVFLAAIPVIVIVIDTLHGNHYRQDLERLLGDGLDQVYEGLHAFEYRHIQNVVELAHSIAVVEAATRLSQITPGASALRDDPMQHAFRSQFAATIASLGYEGYSIVSLDGINLASIRDHDIGRHHPLSSDAAFLGALIDDRPAMSLPVTSDAVSGGSDSTILESRPTMFVGAPIRDTRGEVVVALTLRIDVVDDISRILHSSRTGITGDAYAFDLTGRLLTEPFHHHVSHRLGNVYHALAGNLMLRDPGVDLRNQDLPDTPFGEWPLTWLVAQSLERSAAATLDPLRHAQPAVSSASARSMLGSRALKNDHRELASAHEIEMLIDTDGHRDYRGVPVVGATAWDSSLGLFIATQLDVTEAFAQRDQTTWFAAILGAAVTCLTFCLIVILAAAARRVQKSEAYLQTVMATTSEGMIVAERDGRIEMINHAAAEMFGYRDSQLRGRNLSVLMPEDHRDNYKRILRTTVFDKPVRVNRGRDLFGRHQSGRIFPLEVAIAPLDINGRKKLFGAIQDITDRKALEEINHRAVGEAENANRMKSAFLAQMSHELCTPLNVTKLYAEALREDVTELGRPDLTEDIDRILISTRHQLDLINDALDLAKIEAGRIELVAGAFRLKSLTSELVAIAEPLAANNANRLVTDFSRGPATLVTDEMRLRQILANLLSNAAKFTTEGMICFSSEPFAAENCEWVRFTVSDTGIGMTPEEASTVFESYRQANSSIAKTFGGTGLGLAISEQLSALLGGRLRLETAPGEGSTFMLEIPLVFNGRPADTDTPGRAEAPGAQTYGPDATKDVA